MKYPLYVDYIMYCSYVASATW